MGQIVSGILYGCEVPDCVDDYEVFDDFDDRTAPMKFRTEPDSDHKLMGFFLAVAHDVDEHRGARSIHGRSIALDKLADSSEFAAAVESWGSLARWWTGAFPSVALPEPRLWLTPTEVA